MAPALAGVLVGVVLWALFDPPTTIWFAVVYATGAVLGTSFVAASNRRAVIHGASALALTAILTGLESLRW